MPPEFLIDLLPSLLQPTNHRESLGIMKKNYHNYVNEVIVSKYPKTH